METIFEGRKFRTYPNSKQDSDRSYLRGRGLVNGKSRKVYLHRYKWERLVGPIPDGYEIHHKDGNTHNNALENLECVKGSEHRSAHAIINWSDPGFRKKMQPHVESLTELAKPWHKSDEGREWHRLHASKEKRSRTLTCMHCGREYEGRVKRSENFCGQTCWRMYAGPSKKSEARTCPTCGTVFTVRKCLKKRYCTLKCGAVNKGGSKKRV